MILASTRSTLLLETENRLTEAQGRTKVIEKLLEEKEKLLKMEREKQQSGDSSGKEDSNVLVTTISSLQKLLLEKDTTLSKYQELLKTERQEGQKSFEETQKDVKTLKEKVVQLEQKLMEEEKKLLDLETERSIKIVMGAQTDNAELIKRKSGSPAGTIEPEINDKYIETMFEDDEKHDFEFEARNLELETFELKVQSQDDEIKRLHGQLRDVSNREKIWEKNLLEKTKEIEALNEKLSTNHHVELRDISENVTNRRDIEQLREMLEEKDRHIQDLTDTLTHFHDDQQRFINDTSLHSAEQVAQLSADLNRCEATNRVLNTQIEALKRQITNLSQREKQARELVKTLKNQLIRRPVISVKSDRGSSTMREDHLTRKMQQMEAEMIETKEELRRQTNLAESRRSKNAADLDLWNKQKHWQQTSDKLKIKLKEREMEIEKIRGNFTIAKNTIQRLEREKHLLEGRSIRSAGRFCTSSSCPNIHPSGGTKYTPAESPESYITGSSDNDTDNHQRPTLNSKQEYLESHPEMMETLKTKVEAQQRKIIAMELEGKGSNALTCEYERAQERITSLEAQNLRLEARNLQLQLDNDMIKQGDDGERVRRQVKHLEDYIIVLKDELSQAMSVNVMSGSGGTNVNDSVCKNCSISHSKGSTTSSNKLEQTILALRRVIERLKVDNKNLRDGKNFIRVPGGSALLPSTGNITKEVFEKLRKDYEKLQESHSEALDKISSLQIDVDVGRGGTSNNSGSVNDLNEKLMQKTQLLMKAKILLTRAAAKEKNLREQIEFWKRRCSELQSIPVIDEISEGGMD